MTFAACIEGKIPTLRYRATGLIGAKRPELAFNKRRDEVQHTNAIVKLGVFYPFQYPEQRLSISGNEVTPRLAALPRFLDEGIQST
jgi:hypothetical protein